MSATPRPLNVDLVRDGCCPCRLSLPARLTPLPNLLPSPLPAGPSPRSAGRLNLVRLSGLLDEAPAPPTPRSPPASEAVSSLSTTSAISGLLEFRSCGGLRPSGERRMDEASTEPPPPEGRLPKGARTGPLTAAADAGWRWLRGWGRRCSGGDAVVPRDGPPESGRTSVTPSATGPGDIKPLSITLPSSPFAPDCRLPAKAGGSVAGDSAVNVRRFLSDVCFTSKRLTSASCDPLCGGGENRSKDG